MESDHRSALCHQRLKHCAAHFELIATHNGNQGMTASKQIERLGNITCHHNLMSSASQRLRDTLEKRRVRTYYENRCHYSMRAPSVSARTLMGETPSTSTVFPREDCPATIRTARFDTPSIFARKIISSSFAAPSTGGECSRTFSAVP
jgi:hypothetical protein